MMDVHLVAFEAWNITRYIFVTNKRQEIAGASELITHLDRHWVHRALREMWEGFDPEWEIDEHPVALLSEGAGSVTVLVRDGDQARRLVTLVTVTALREAPGLDVYGVVGPSFGWGHGADLANAVRDVSAALAVGRVSRPGPDDRFPRLPIFDECVTTGLPAAVERLQLDGSVEARSTESEHKLDAYRSVEEGDGLRRLGSLANARPGEIGRVIGYLQDDAEWVAVVYADGNGVGEVFRSFDTMVDDPTARAYARTMRAFTEGLDECARKALATAIDAVRERPAAGGGGGLPAVLPLILGGDDVVLLCDGAIALGLTVEFLRAYERLTAEDPAVAGPLRRAGRTGLSASAGVAIVKAHHPFQSAARLAYELLTREAKQVKKHVPGPCSAVAFHALFDSTDVSLARLRGQGHVGTNGPGAYSTVAQPYVVSPVDPDNGWARGRRWADLQRRVEAITARDEDDERRLPATQLHELRQALFGGPPAADARLANALPRYHGRGLDVLCGEPGSLFWTEEPGGRRVTGLLDAMDAAQFWGARG